MKGKLYIDDVLADTNEIDFEIDIFIKDIAEFIHKSNKTTTINLPGTATNKLIFDFLESTITVKTTALKTGRLEVGGLVIRGKIKEFDATKNGEDVNYRIQLISNTGDWVKDIEGLKLSDLDFSSDNHTYDKATLDASETLDLTERGYIYPVINHGDTIDSDVLRLVERYIAVSVKTIVEKIFNEKGYSPTDNLTTKLTNLFLPYTQSGKKDNLTDEVLEDLLFNVALTANETDTQTIAGSATAVAVSLSLSPISFDDEVSTGLYDNGSNFNVLTHKYIVDGAKTLNFKADIYVVLTTPAAIINNATKTNPKYPVVIVQIKNGATVIAEQTKTLTLTSTVSDTFNLETNYMAFADADEITVHISLTDLVDNQDPTGNDYVMAVSSTNSRFYNASLDWYGYGDSIVVSDLLPDVLQTDFLKWLFIMFNVNPLTDVHTKEVYLQTAEEFYTDEIWDWSDKLIEGIKTTKPNPKTYKFELKTDSNDKYAEFKINENKTLNGNYDYEVTEPDSEVVVSSGFSPSIMERWAALGFNADLIPKLWSNVPDSDNADAKWTTKFNLRLLYYVGITNLDGSDEWYFKSGYGTTAAHKQVTRTDFPNMVSYNDTVNFYFNDISINGLFDTYWKDAIIKINNNMVLEAMFRLNVNDIQGILDNENNRDARAPILIDQEGLRGNYEIIELTNYKFDDIIKVKLLKR